MNEKQYIQEDEINLRELINPILRKKYFVLILTSIVTIVSIIYALTKTPIYEVRSVIKIGHIGNHPLEKSELLVEKLNLIFHVGLPSNIISKNKAIVSKISIVKKVESFIEIYTQGFSNKDALKKNKEVLTFIKTEYKEKIDDYKYSIQLKIDNLKREIKHINSVDIVNLDEEIKFLKEVKLVSIENQLKFNDKKLKEYEKNINNISNKISRKNNENLFYLTEILTNQNLILNLKNKIEKLNIDKKLLLTETIRKLQLTKNIELKNKIKMLNENIENLKLSLKTTNISNSRQIAEYILNDDPIKPKKALIIVLSFITGVILSIFLVFFMQFMKSFKKEND